MVTAVDSGLVCVIRSLQSKDTRGEFEWKGEGKPHHHLASLRKHYIYLFFKFIVNYALNRDSLLRGSIRRRR